MVKKSFFLEFMEGFNITLQQICSLGVQMNSTRVVFLHDIRKLLSGK